MKNLIAQICLVAGLLIWTGTSLRCSTTHVKLQGFPLKSIQGTGQKEHNQKVGGKPKSSHLIGKAADIAISNSQERWAVLTALQDAGFSRLGVAKTFIHVDSDEAKSSNVIWTY